MADTTLRHEPSSFADRAPRRPSPALGRQAADPAASAVHGVSAGRRAHTATKLFYGSGSLAFGVKDNGFSVLLLLYYNQVLGLPAALAGGVVALALVVDSFLDPVTGYVSDNFHSRWGRRHPFMYAAALPTALSYLLLWNPPAGLSQPLLAIYLFVVAVLVRSFITLYEVPSSALGPELSEDYDQRTSYMSFRYLFGWVGGVTMYVLAFSVFLQPGPAHPVGQLNPAGYHNYAIAASLIMFVSIIVSSLGTHGAIPRLKAPPARRRIPPSTAVREILGALGNPSALALLGAGLAVGLSAGLAFALNTYFYTFFWQLKASQIATLGLSSYISATGALVAAPWLSRHMDKKHAAMIMALSYAVLAPLPYLLSVAGWFPPDGSPLLLPVLFFSFTVTVSISIVPPILIGSMISDVVEDNQIRTGRRTEGVLFAANAFILKCVSGLGLAGGALILSLVHFPQRASPGHVPAGVLHHLALSYAAALTLLNLVAIAFVRGHRISREAHAANLRTLAAQAAAIAPDGAQTAAPAPR